MSGEGTLEPGVEALVELSLALAVRGEPDRMARAVRRAHAHADPIEVEEALLQSYLFLGYPTALNGIRAWREATGEPALPPSVDDWDGWRKRGGQVCAQVYGGQYDRLRVNIAALHPDMERWMIAEGYGKVLGRPGLALWKRELCIVALLAPQDAEPQLYAHLRGALNAGAAVEVVDAAVTWLEGEGMRVEGVWARVRGRE